jgi:hypothetical protein
VRTWPRWAPFDEAEVESGEGVGEIRRFRVGRVTTKLPGTGRLVRRRLAQFIAETAEGLAREAEKPVPS